MTDKTPKELRGVISAAMGLIDGAANVLYAAGEEVSSRNIEAWKRKFSEIATLMDEKGDQIISESGIQINRRPLNHIHAELDEQAPELLANPPQFH